MIPFYDSTDPAALIPTASFTHVAGYANGRFAWPENQFARFKRFIKIGVFPGQPEQAHDARVLDIERFDAGVSDFPPFARVRHSLGHDDALAYCSLSLVPDLVDAMDADQSTPWGLWVAWWWGRPHPPTAADIAAELRALYGLTLPPGRLRACQWQPGGPFDSSVWYTRDTFSRVGK